jgi:hypothetical protein
MRWTEERGGRPALLCADGTESLRLDFTGLAAPPHRIRPISWHEFFERFEHARLALRYEDEPAAEIPSRFFRLVPRDE